MSHHDDRSNLEWTEEKREDFRRKRRPKNLAMLFLLLAFIVLVYIVAVVRMGSG